MCCTAATGVFHEFEVRANDFFLFFIAFLVVLPRMAVMAATNNHNPDESKRFEIAMQLFEAYSSLSCCGN